jgi:hypothetical protein
MSDIIDRLNGNGEPWTFAEVIAEIERLTKSRTDWRNDAIEFETKSTTLRAEIERLREIMKRAIRQFEDGNRLECHRTLCDEIYGKQL